VVNTLQPLAEGVEIRRSLVVRDARRLEGDERIQRHESVEPEDSVLDRRENGLEEAAQRYGAPYRVLESLPPNDVTTVVGSPTYSSDTRACTAGGGSRTLCWNIAARMCRCS